MLTHVVITLLLDCCNNYSALILVWRKLSCAIVAVDALIGIFLYFHCRWTIFDYKVLLKLNYTGFSSLKKSFVLFPCSCICMSNMRIGAITFRNFLNRQRKGFCQGTLYFQKTVAYVLGPEESLRSTPGVVRAHFCADKHFLSRYEASPFRTLHNLATKHEVIPLPTFLVTSTTCIVVVNGVQYRPILSPGARGKHRRHYAALAALNALGLPTYEIKNEGGQDEPEIPPLSFVTVPKEGKGQVPMSRVPVTGSLNLLDDASTLSTSLRRKFNCNFL